MGLIDMLRFRVVLHFLKQRAIGPWDCFQRVNEQTVNPDEPAAAHLGCTSADAFCRRLKDFKRIYEYQGEATCAADGMCQEKCPVKINTGELIKSIRAEQMKDMKQASGGAMVRVAPIYRNKAGGAWRDLITVMLRSHAPRLSACDGPCLLPSSAVRACISLSLLSCMHLPHVLASLLYGLLLSVTLFLACCRMPCQLLPQRFPNDP